MVLIFVPHHRGRYVSVTVSELSKTKQHRKTTIVSFVVFTGVFVLQPRCDFGAVVTSGIQQTAWVLDNDVSLCFGCTKVSFTRNYLVGTLQLLRSDGLRTQLLFPLDVIYVFCQYNYCEPCPVTIRVVVGIYKIKYQLVMRVGLIIKSCNKWRDQNYVHHIGHSKRVLSMVTNLRVRC